MPRSGRGLAAGLLYISGVAQGLALVTFPAASAIFTSPSGFAFSSSQYGAMFVPQVGLAIVASALSPGLSARIGLRNVLMLGLGCDGISMALLAGSAGLQGSGAALRGCAWRQERWVWVSAPR